MAAAAPLIVDLVSSGVRRWLNSRGRSKPGVRNGNDTGEPRPSLPRSLDNPSGLSASLVVYPVILHLDLPIGAPVNVLVVAGNVASSTSMDVRALIIAWATRFQVIFTEFCLVGLRLVIRNGTRGAGAVDGGVTAFYLDESSAAAPTSAQAAAHPRLELQNAGVESGSRQLGRMAWTAHDYTDLSWSDTAVSTNPVYLKAFTGAGFLTPAANTQSWIVDGSFRVAFRGLRT